MDAEIERGLSEGMAAVAVTSLKELDHTMKAVEWMGKHQVAVIDRLIPKITMETDVIIKISSTAICGSDLHLYDNSFPGIMKGDILGHEFMGNVVEIGSKVQKIKKGDRVVACFNIACGSCFFCERQLYTLCDNTNPSSPMADTQEQMYGHKMAGIYGYGHCVGGYDGGQAEYVRVLFGDLNLLKVPESVADEKVLFLSDILATAWHANELSSVSKDDSVAIWGCGPVGILAAHCAFNRGARHVILVDCEQYRLDFAVEKIAMGSKLSTINFKKCDVKQTLTSLMGKNGVDCGIDACGYRYNRSWMQSMEKAVQLATDTSEVLNEMVTCVRKGGRLGIVGDYVGFCNHFNIGAFMEKGMSMAGGQTPVQKYWHLLLDKIVNGELTPAMVITHEFPLERAADAYRMFNGKEDGCIKVVLKPHLASSAV